MYRRAIVSVVALIALLVACGRQITPSNSSSGLLAGTMRIRFDTAGPMNFSKYQYVIVFNTSGNGQEPYANAYTTGFLNYSFVWLVNSQGSGAVAPTLTQFYPNSSGGLQGFPVSVPPQYVQLVTDSNGSNNEFTLQFQRILFTTIPPNASPTPVPTSSVEPSATPTTLGQSIWHINVFTMDMNNNIIDAGGAGPNDTSFSLPIDTTQSVDNAQPFNKAGAPTVADPAAQIAGGEIINAP